MASGGGNIKVVVRCRPFNGREIDRRAQCIVQMKGDQTILSPPKNVDVKGKAAKAASEGTKTFAFDKSYWSFDKSTFKRGSRARQELELHSSRFSSWEIYNEKVRDLPKPIE
ncbi:hypothetical protein SNOG_04290 [Parastagonospora nodorum SN15]|uniref:Kinesin motor domain-containing protein n=1 Tax=Phaeosphaeria nodorum (strain SN15 / ATCC MYA-4574 / FGSC 10173) TaxID=321614 RepID=Q0UVC4_PHANO|nr:hypothetical protein SNOG_04290 [Parastagonospora nodorum SN15]EAT88050.1 hypothetical protein SNOG_04290 [Parastagonospora nodorum SN15]